MSERIPPTRMNLLRVRREATRTAEGVRLLRSKRESLVAAFLASVRERVRYHDRLRAKAREAAGSLADALAAEGRSGLLSYGWAARRDYPLEVTREVVWGIPLARYRPGPLVRDYRERGFDPSGNPRVNRAADRFEEFLALVLEMAATDVRLKRIGAELRRTTRRIHALEERLLPRLARQSRRIAEKLEELERDENQRLKRLKVRRARRG